MKFEDWWNDRATRIVHRPERDCAKTMARAAWNAALDEAARIALKSTKKSRVGQPRIGAEILALLAKAPSQDSGQDKAG